MKTFELHHPLIQLLITVSNDPLGAILPRMQSILMGREGNPLKYIREFARENTAISVLSTGWICVGLDA